MLAIFGHGYYTLDIRKPCFARDSENGWWGILPAGDARILPRDFVE
jgi:hypothetical protein